MAAEKSAVCASPTCGNNTALSRIGIALILAAGFFLYPAPVADTPILVVDSGGHESPVRALAFTSDGKLLYSAGDDKVVRVWDVEKGITVRTIRGQIGEGDEGKIYTLALSPGNHVLAVAGFMRHAEGVYVRLHDLRNNGDVLRVLVGPTDAVTHVAFSPDGRKLASACGDGVVRIHDLSQSSNKPSNEFKGHQGRVHQVSFSPDGRQLASAGADKSVRLWDVNSGKSTPLVGHQNRVVSAVFSPAGKYLASAAEDGQILLWDSKSGKFLKVLTTHGGTVANLSFSNDGRKLLVAAKSEGGQPVAQLYSVPDGQPLPRARFTEHNQPITATALAPTGHRSATAGGLRNEVYVWDTETGQSVARSPLVGHGKAVLKVAFGANGESVSYSGAPDGSDQKVFYLHEKGKYKPVFGGDRARVGGEYSGEVTQVRDLKLKLAGPSNDTAQVLELVRGGSVAQAIKRTDSTGYRHLAYTLTPDGQHIISGGVGGYLSVFRSADGQLLREFKGHTGNVMSVAASPDGPLFVSGGADQTIRIWDLNQSTPLLNIFVADNKHWVAWIPAGYYTTNGEADQFVGWHTNRGPEKTAIWEPASTYLTEFYKPNVVALYLERRNLKEALSDAREPTAHGPATVAKLHPPFVKLHWPPSRTDTRVAEPTIVVKATAQSITAPITRYQILVDGLIKADEKVATPTEELDIIREVPITPGKANKIEVACYNGTDLSKPGMEWGTVFGESDKPLPTRNMYVLAVGIKKYKDPGMQLQFADADAREMIAVMETQRGGLFDQIKVYPRDADPKRYPGAGSANTGLIDGNATIENMKYGLAWLREARQEDLKVIFLSGHGGIVNDEYFFWCYAFNREDPAPEVQNLDRTTLMKNVMLMKGQILLIIDTCHSGAVGEKNSRDEPDSYLQYFKYQVPKGRTIFTYHSSGRNEKSKEDLQWKHGAFTYALLQALRQGKALKAPKPVITARDLGAYLREQVSELNRSQNADYFPNPSGADDFPVFYPKNAGTTVTAEQRR